ncbi:hypothetical protein D4R75_06990 [bacterium]|nr:MAG: hypothetical protein D4R75_06990 [bacterium]
MKALFRFTTIVLVCTLAICVVSNGNAQDKKITKKDVPAAVLKAFEGAYPKAKVNNYGTEVEKGVTFYELETVEGKIKRDLLYKADGTLAEAEEILTQAMVPDDIAKAVKAEFPKGKIVSGEKTTQGKVVTFDIVVANGKEKVSVNLNADGKIQKKTVMKPKKEKGEKEEKEEKD